jgi:hypothetical protein
MPKGWVRRRLRGEGGVQLAQGHDLGLGLMQSRPYLISTGHQEERPILFDIPCELPASHHDLALGGPGPQPLAQVAGRS